MLGGPIYGFDGIVSTCVFAWEERAEDSARFNLTQINQYAEKNATS